MGFGTWCPGSLEGREVQVRYKQRLYKYDEDSLVIYIFFYIYFKFRLGLWNSGVHEFFTAVFFFGVAAISRIYQFWDVPMQSDPLGLERPNRSNVTRWKHSKFVGHSRGTFRVETNIVDSKTYPSYLLEISHVPRKKPWLVVWYRGLYYTIIWGL